jgi:hypothetical protein
MEFKATLQDGTGQHEITLDMGLYKSEQGFVGALNSQFPTPQGMPTASEQLFAQCGLYRTADLKSGIKPAKIRDILDGGGLSAAGTAPGSTGISRFVAPAAILAGVQNDIYEDRSGVLAQFMNLVAFTQSVAGNRYEKPVFNYDPARNSRSKPVAQLAEPTSIGLLTVGEQSGTIPIFASGLEISDQAMDYFGFAEVQKCMSIMATYDIAERADGWLLSMMAGDADHGMAALSGDQVEKAVTIDSSIAAAGVLTQKAWIKWIAKHSKRAPITHVITDIDGALAIQNRTGRPTANTDNQTSQRMDTIEVVMDPLWPSNLPIYIVTDANWPVNTILGISKPNAIVLHESSTAQYSSVEQFVTRRSTKFRVDFGAVASRFYTRAFHRLNLIL